MPSAPRHLRLVPGRGRVCALALGAGMLAGLGGPGWVFAAPTVGCQAERVGPRTFVEVRLADFLDEELLRLIRLGLGGRIHVEAILFRRRRFWVDERLAENVQAYTFRWSKERVGYVLEDRPVESPLRFTLPAFPLRPGSPRPHSPLYVDVSVRVEVVTAGSLGQVAQWIVGRDPPAGGDNQTRAETAAPVGVTRALVDFLAADLARTADTRCVVRS